MRKLSLFLAFALLMTCSAYGQYAVISIDNVSNDYGAGTQLRAGKTHVLQVNYDLTSGDLVTSPGWTGSNGYELYSPDGADWGYMSATTGPLVDGLPGSVVKYQYHYQLVGTTWSRTSNNGVDPCPDAATIDRAGFYLATVDFTGAGYDQGTSGIALNFEFTTDLGDAGLTMCFDSLDAITAWEWAAGSAGDFPLWDNGLGASAPRCWEIYEVPNEQAVWCDPPGVEETLVPFNHCGQGSYQLCATDPDEGNTVTFTFGPGFETGFGEITDDMWTWSGPTVPQNGGADITFIAYDQVEYSSQMFTLHVTTTNNAPVFDVCPSALATVSNATMRAQTVAFSDPDVCDVPTISVTGWAPSDPADVVTVNGNDIEFTPNGGTARTVVMTVEVTDGDQTAECVLNWNVILGSKYQVELEKLHDVFQGHFVDLPIILWSADAADGLGGFDLLVAYDASALAFQLAIEGDVYDDGFYDWEYFTYRFGPYGNCGNACPSGMVRVVGMAETNNGLAEAECVYDATAKPVLAYLRFLVSNDRTLECQYVPIRFYWYDCTDNILSSCDGSKAYLSAAVFDYVGNDVPFLDGEITDPFTGFPTFTGAQSECEYVDLQLGKVADFDVDFQDGGIDIICADSIDARGDINLNGLAYEIADAVMFTNYFINGLAAFGTHIDGSIAATDVNADGIALSVADLVYLVRVVIGDAAPYPKAAPVAANITYGNDRFNVDVEMGAAHIVMEGNVVPNLLADNMDMLYRSNGQTTSILVYSTEANQSFRGDFLQVSGNIVSTEFATFTGARVAAKVMPSTFVVEQNYPNPFNPTTNFKFTVPNGGNWELGVYNITGQLVESFSGVSETGYEMVVWDASDFSSGIYFYRVSTDEQSVTKKAVLLK